MSEPTSFDAAADFLHFELASEKKKCAYERLNYASVALENAQIRERLAEIKSQHEPLASLSTALMPEQAKLYAAAFYVVVGRMP